MSYEPTISILHELKHYKCPKCGYECEDYSMQLCVYKDENAQPYEAHICACCYVKWMGKTFPHMVEIKKGEIE